MRGSLGVLREFMGSPGTHGRVSGSPEKVHGISKTYNSLMFAIPIV